MNRGMIRTLVMGLVIGLVMAGLGLIWGGRTSLSVDWQGVHVPSGKPVKLHVDEQLSFDKLVIDVSVADVSVIRGKKFEIKADYQDGIVPSYSLSGGVLKIQDEGARSFNLNFGFYNPANRVEVTLPDRRLNSAEISSDVGDVNLNSLNTGALTVRSSTGSITAKDIAFDDGKFECGVGDVEIHDVTSGKLYLSSGTGDVGASGVLRGETRITSGVGSVNVTTKLPRTDYRVRANASLGKVWLSPEGGSDGGPHTLIMESGVGSVSCEFAR